MVTGLQGVHAFSFSKKKQVNIIPYQSHGLQNRPFSSFTKLVYSQPRHIMFIIDQNQSQYKKFIIDQNPLYQPENNQNYINYFLTGSSEINTKNIIKESVHISVRDNEVNNKRKTKLYSNRQSMPISRSLDKLTRSDYKNNRYKNKNKKRSLVQY